MASVLPKIANLNAFAEEPTKNVEEEMARILRGTHEAEFDKLQHLGETVFGRVRKLVAFASKSFQARDREIESVAAGFISGVPVLLLGPPGTAKSAVVRTIASLCGLASGESSNGGNGGHSPQHRGYFEYLMTNHTMPEELFGPPDLRELADGKFKRVITGKLPVAEIAFLDEVFRGGGHILNTLLTIINEKRFDSGDGAIHVPLLGLVGASNDIPREQDLEAFFDRFPVRNWVYSILDPQSRKLAGNVKISTARLAGLSVEAERKRLADAWDGATASVTLVQKRLSCTNDFRFARMLLLHGLAAVVENSPRFTQFDQMFRAVRDRARLSDRAFGQLWLFAAALDLLRPSKAPSDAYPKSTGHLDVFRYVARSPQDALWLNEVVTQHMQGIQHNGVA